jgi:hypothetical protein
MSLWKTHPFRARLMMAKDLAGPDRRAGRSSGSAPSGRALPGRTGDSWRAFPAAALCLLALLLTGLEAPAQTAAPGSVLTTPAGRVLLQGGARPAPAAQPLLDPRTAALMQQVGTDSNVVVTAEFDPAVVGLGQMVTYRVVVTAMVEGVSVPDHPPAPADLTLTPAGRGFNYSTAAGMLQPRTTLNFRVSVKAAGTYVLPAYKASANGRDVTIPEARLVVLAPGAPGARQALRLLAEVPQEDYYIGQAVPVRLVLLDSGDNSLQAVSQPQATGDAIMSEPIYGRQGRETRPVNGRQVLACLTAVQVTPIKEGRIEFAAQAYGHVSRPGLNVALGMSFETVLVSAEPVAITVKHLPKEGELPGFTGGIGSFQVEAPKVSTNTVRAGEPLTLSIQVRGEGNLGRLLPPRLERIRGWQAFPPLMDNTMAVPQQLRGAVSFTYTLIPLSDQVKATPAIPFCFFDPKRKAYIDATVPPVAIQVLPGPGGGPAAVAEVGRSAGAGADDPDQAGAERDLVMTGLAESPGPAASSLAPLQARPWFLVFQLVPATILGGLWFYDRRRRYLAQHPELVLKARARRRLRRHLRRLRQAAAARDADGFVAGAVSALREASAPLEAANPQALVGADVLRNLAPGQRAGPEGRLVSELFAAADALQFFGQAPDGAALLKRQPEVEALLAAWRGRL